MFSKTWVQYKVVHDGLELGGGLHIPLRISAEGNDSAVHGTLVTDYLGQGPCVHPINPNDTLLLQVLIYGTAAPEVGGLPAPLPHDVSHRMGLAALRILPDNAIVPGKGECLQDDLSVVAGIRQGLEIPCHPRGKDNLAGNAAGRTETLPLKDLPIGKHDICFSIHTKAVL